MNKNPISVTPKTTVAYAAHIMGWDGIKLCPVVDKKKLSRGSKYRRCYKSNGVCTKAATSMRKL